MRNPRMMFVLVIAIVCGLGASFLVARYVTGQQVQAPKVKIWWVEKDKTQSAYTPLDKKNFTQRDMDQKDAEDGNFVIGDEEFDSLVKEKKMVKVSLGSGKPLMRGDIYNAASDSLRGLLEPGQVAATIKVDEVTSVAGFVQPGHRVDLESTTQQSTGEGNKPFTQIILQNLEVLATDAQTSPSAEAPSKPATKVTLRLTREQALLLGSYQESGTLRLLLRPVKDKEIYVVKGRFPFGQSTELTSTNTAPDSPDQPLSAATPPPMLPAVDTTIAPPAGEKPPEKTSATVTETIPPPSSKGTELKTEPKKFKMVIIDVSDKKEPVKTKTFQVEEDTAGDNKGIRIPKTGE